MEKFQPKIYSLSTLNIRQHFNCDYRFHDFRTDFSGESGSGKSLVADFIQLLLVGSRVFKSGTEGVRHRDTSGLVLKGAGRKYGRGYIFINVEVKRRQYITIGGYLETTSSQMQFFIIQAGYDFEETLLPMDQPIFYRDLLIDGQIEALENLEKRFLEKGYLRSLSNKKYHSLLFNNGILAVDLSQNLQSLKSYAAIIRSFSRGKGYFTDSDALKTFLFGDEDHKRLVEKYHDEVQNINVDQQQHQRLVEEIAAIKSKEQKIERVLRDFKVYDKLRKEFSQKSASYWFSEKENLSIELERAQLRYDTALIKNLLVKRKLAEVKEKDISQQQKIWIASTESRTNGKSEKDELETTYQQAKVQFDQSTKTKEIIDKVQSWFTNDRKDISDLRQWHARERAKITDKELLLEFQNFLSSNHLERAFGKSIWFEDYGSAASTSTRQLIELQCQIDQVATQLVFCDLENPDSLAHWAIANLQLPLSLEQESILVHFQSLSRNEPSPPKDRYLPFPEKLFLDPEMVQTHQGFWLELNGIHEFIKCISQQSLNVPADQVNIGQQSLSELKREYAQLKNDYEALKNLKDKLEGYPALEKAISLYKSDLEQLFSDIDDISQLTVAELERHLLIYEESEQLLETYNRHKQTYDESYAATVLYHQRDKVLSEKIERIEQDMLKQYGSKDFHVLLDKEKTTLSELNATLAETISTEETTEKKIKEAEAQLLQSPSSITGLFEMVANSVRENQYAQDHLINCRSRQGTAATAFEEARKIFLLDHRREFSWELDLLPISEQPLESPTSEAHNKFRLSYDLASDEIEDKTILKDYDIGVLANKLLPTVFPTQEIQEELVGEQIEQRLIELTNDLQQIGSRKIEILHNVFNEVQRIYNDYLTKVNKISNYLSSNEITGGNFATLQYKPAPGYPEGWSKIFRKRLSTEMQDVGLFAKSHKQDIDEIMISVFREANGTREAKVADLLNPRSYFDLHFEIKHKAGTEGNSGSNGQTYTANALLCLARLSLIEDNELSGIRVMPIDEAEGLGSNYEMLHRLARKENYQLVTMSIETAGEINDHGQYIYIMHDNKDANGTSYVPPLGIFQLGQLTENIHEIFEETK